MPTLEFSEILLGHGSGGLLTNKLLESGVFSLLDNPYLAPHHDGSIVEVQGKIAFTTDSFVISPIFFPGGDIGELSVNGTVNDLAMCGAIPRFLSLSFILEEGLPMSEFWQILCSIKAAAENAGVQIITGDTKVVDRGKGDKVFINTTGIGEVHPRADIHPQRVSVGDKIIINGDIAAHGMAIMSVREGLEFETTIESDTAPLHQAVLALLDEFGDRIHLLRDATRGGVATVLAEISRHCSTGIELWEKEIPVAREVAGACEILGLDPLYVANEGRFVALVDPEVASAAVELLKDQQYCPSPCIVGEVVEEHPGQVILISRIGGRRTVNMLPGEQLPRIC
ncbi:MAG: hydrogenase expression/formation protein HypE [Calditrichaeota bacterium]|nr:MAG: hydrogenase expression/formation protein HypE [Calditrichota bacterium]